MDQFPENAKLIQFFASFSSAILFVETERRRIQSIIANLFVTLIINEEIREAGEDLAGELGKVLETRMLITNLKNRVENLQ